MILMIDNYDSFTYNLVQYFAEMKERVAVYRNDCISLNEIYDLKPEIIVISPGPCTPLKAGNSLEIIREFAGKVPILGVCLGHQAIGEAFGAKVIRAIRPMHGKTSMISHDNQGVYKGLKNPLQVCRYHSLILDPKTIPSCLEITSWSEEGEIMGVRHKQFLMEGMQFHPEAILTPNGKELLHNFIQLARSISMEGQK